MISDGGHPTTRVAGTAAQARAHAERLAAVLRSRRWKANVVDAGGRIAVRVVNPDAPILSENVLCRQGPPGEWAYWWPWREQIGTAGDVSRAADRIVHVLRATEE
jgi:hypothetical protein